ncbi:MAG: hypothetical protein ACE5Z5_11240 [Candidatus Bathyarchaeia archaeon]
MRRLRGCRRGQATAVGAVFFFLIVVLLINFLYEVYNTQAAMNRFDAEKAQERYIISNALFGDMKTYSTQTATLTATVTSGSGTDPFTNINSTTMTSGSTFPISNMNFSGSANYWSFTKSYYGTGSGSSGASGAYTTDPTGSPSGAGAVYAHFSYNPPGGKFAGAYMNWTTRFYIDLTELGVLTSVKLSWGRRVTSFFRVSGPSPGDKCPITVYLVEPDGKEHQIGQVIISGEDVGWVQRSGLEVSTSFIPASGWYTVVIVTQVELKHSGTGPPEFQVQFDDVGLILKSDTYVIDWYGSFTIEEAPTLVEQIDVSYTGRFNDTCTQSLYILDTTNDRWVPLGTSTVTTSSRTFTYTFSGSEAQSYVSKTGEIKVRVYAVGTAPFMCVADSMSVKDYFTGTTDKITLSFTNTGGVGVHIVSLWIIDSAGHHHFDMDIDLTPGQTKQHTLDYTWSYGEYEFKAVTDKGTIVTYTTTA